jgi:putative DNA primase/helicase
VIASLVTIAQARGWNEITVRGTERFRKEAWFAARIAGLEVRGYRPSDFEQAHLVRAVAREEGKGAPEPATTARSTPPSPGGANSAARASTRDMDSAPKESRDRLLLGRLVDHGRATYHHDPHEPTSYFVKIETTRGDRTIWGVDLERALRESLTRPQIGEEVGLRALRQESVTVKAPSRDAQGRVIGQQELATHRNQWIIEKRAFFEQRAEAARTLRDGEIDAQRGVKRHPELVGTYHQVRAAELAAKQLRDPEDQRRFVAQVRSALADSVARGEPLPPVRVREDVTARRAGRTAPPREREAVVRG